MLSIECARQTERRHSAQHPSPRSIRKNKTDEDHTSHDTTHKTTLGDRLRPAQDQLHARTHNTHNICTPPQRTALRTAPHRTALAPHRTAPHSHRTAPHRTAPHRTAPHRTAPHRTAPHRTAHRTAPHRTAPHRTAPHRTAPHRTALHTALRHTPLAMPLPTHAERPNGMRHSRHA